MIRKLSCVLWVSLLVAGCDKDTNRREAVQPMGAECGDYEASEKIPDAWLRCSADAECVRAHDDCCGCSGGSDGVAIAKAYSACLAVDCSESPTCPATEACLDTRVVCSEGLCGLAPIAAPKPPESVDCSGYAAGGENVPKALLECASDRDCTLATYTCCPCSSGGDQVAVATKHASCIQPADCEPTQACSDAYRCDEYQVSCDKGICKRRAKNTKEARAEDVLD